MSTISATAFSATRDPNNTGAPHVRNPPPNPTPFLVVMTSHEADIHWTELVKQAKSLDGGTFPLDDEELTEANRAGLVLAACETFWGHGFANDQLGSVDDFGHHYRVSRWTVETDGRGFSTLTEHGSEAEAIAWWSTMEDEYNNWYDDEDDA